jgi:GMP synthase (glutamine-hydrolysing)
LFNAFESTFKLFGLERIFALALLAFSTSHRIKLFSPEHSYSSQGGDHQMTRVLAVNNYPSLERFERLKVCLEEVGATVTTADKDQCSTALFNDFDGVALSGSPDMLSDSKTVKKYKAELEAIRQTDIPILGVCFGHQLMGIAFGTEVIGAPRPVLGFVDTRILVDDPLFSGLPKTSKLLESRHEIVKNLPEDFRLLAKSAESPIAAMKHKVRPLYGVQSHPERYSSENPAGKGLVRNFVRILS